MRRRATFRATSTAHRICPGRPNVALLALKDCSARPGRARDWRRLGAIVERQKLESLQSRAMGDDFERQRRPPGTGGTSAPVFEIGQPRAPCMLACAAFPKHGRGRSKAHFLQELEPKRGASPGRVLPSRLHGILFERGCAPWPDQTAVCGPGQAPDRVSMAPWSVNRQTERARWSRRQKQLTS